MARAVVCDKCGNVVLLDDKSPYTTPSGIYSLVGDKAEYRLDLCECCVKELFGRVRNGGEADG